MCNNNSEDGEVQKMVFKTKLNLVGRDCKKCTDTKKSAEVVLRVKDTYCRSCFLASISHKFRSSLGKSRLMKPKDRVLIAFSGSQSSVALLHLIHAGISETSHKKLLFDPIILYLDEGAILGKTRNEREETLNQIESYLNNFKFLTYVLPLEIYAQSPDITRDNFNPIHSGLPMVDNTMIKELFKTISSSTTKEDFLFKLRFNCLIKAAKIFNCCKIFTAETSDCIAVKLLSNLALGRGAQLPFDVGFCDTRDSIVKILRPMRDISKKEVAFYNIFNNLNTTFISKMSTMSGVQSSIQKLTESFVTDLQESFPATVSTIFRTGEKLNSKHSTLSDENICPLCNAPLDTENVESSSLNATKFSCIISSLGPEAFDSLTLTQLNQTKSNCNQNSENDHSCSCSSSQSAKELNLENIRDVVCYSCYLIMKEMDLKVLPPHLMNLLEEKIKINSMRNEISDFLL